MTESESVALPLGDTPLTDDIIAELSSFVNSFFDFFFSISAIFLKNSLFSLNLFLLYGIIFFAAILSARGTAG